jgi:hypothetical protein
MPGISNFLEEAILNAVFNSAALDVAAVYVSLHTGDPGETGADEVTGGTYARQDASAAFAPASGGAIQTDVDIDWPADTMPACTITHLGVWDAATSGNFLWGGALAASKVVNANDPVHLEAGDLDVTLD